MQFGFLSPYQGSRLLGFESLSNQLFIQCPFVHLIMQILTLFVSAPVLPAYRLRGQRNLWKGSFPNKRRSG